MCCDVQIPFFHHGLRCSDIQNFHFEVLEMIRLYHTRVPRPNCGYGSHEHIENKSANIKSIIQSQWYWVVCKTSSHRCLRWETKTLLLFLRTNAFNITSCRSLRFACLQMALIDTAGRHVTPVHSESAKKMFRMLISSWMSSSEKRVCSAMVERRKIQSMWQLTLHGLSSLNKSFLCFAN